MKYKIDTTTWKRREHYEFFNGMDDPFWGTVVPGRFYGVLPRSQEEPHFVLPLFPAPYSNGRKPNRGIPIPDRKRGGGLLRPNPREPDYRTRGRQLRLRILRVLFPTCTNSSGRPSGKPERVKAADGLCLGAGAGRTDLIYFSAVPWFAFTEMKHARSANRGDSIPRISTGKLTRSGDRLTMPVSLDVHHGFIDGRQAGEFFALLENRE